MTNTVSPETARRLAAAGFPQPSPAPGQWWGDEEKTALIINEWTDARKRDYFAVLTTVNIDVPVIDFYFDAKGFAGLVYLPTVVDILKELQKDCRRGFWWALAAPMEDDLWGCGNYERNEGKNMETLHEHPAEAAALAYLSIHEKSKT